MTEIHLLLTDQELTVSKKPTIASGDINAVQIVVNPVESWDDYITFTAVFYTSNDSTPYEVLMTGKMDSEGEMMFTAVVPPEVLVQKGTLFMGVRGATEDGSRIKTSEVIKYKIIEGAPASKKTLFASPDIYQQYLEQMNAGLTPTRTAMEQNFFNYTQQAKAEMLASLPNALSGQLLWENPDPTAEFAAQTIELDLSNYKRIHIITANEITGSDELSYSETVITQKDVLMCMFNDTTSGSSNSGHKHYMRRAKMMDTGIFFQDAHIVETHAYYNEYVIPVKIIGYIY